MSSPWRPWHYNPSSPYAAPEDPFGIQKPEEEIFLEEAEMAAHSRVLTFRVYFWLRTREALAHWLREEPVNPDALTSYFAYSKSWRGHLDELRAARHALWQSIQTAYVPNAVLPKRTPF